MTGTTDHRPMEKPAAVRPHSLWLLAGIGGVLLALLVLSLSWKDSRKLARIAVEGAAYLPEKEVLERAALTDGALIDSISLGAVRKRLLAHPYIREARLSRTWPDAVTISIEERVPVASFTIGGAIRYIDAEGVVLPYVASGIPYDLPGIAGIPQLGRTRIGEAVEGKELEEALGILRAALETDSSVYHLISEVDMRGGGDVYLYSSESAVPILFGRGDASRKFTLLGAFWERFVRDGGPENLEYIDLRFNDQVVVKWINNPQKSVNLSSM